MADPPPSPVFCKNIKAKELREGVCEECENKGFRGSAGEDVEGREGKEAKERGVWPFMVGPRVGAASGRKKGGSRRSRRELLLNRAKRLYNEAGGVVKRII